MSKYGVIFGPYFPVFGLNTGKYGPEITPYLDTFHAVFFTNCRYLFRSQSNIYDKTFCENISRSLAKDSIINVWQGPEYASALLSVLLTLRIFESAGRGIITQKCIQSPVKHLI